MGAKNFKDSQIYIRSETKFELNHDLKFWPNDFQANCFPIWIITYITQYVVK